ncbi:hypothetical protein [Roseibium aggregatum]|uniref:hypothetical protein n=1 Tax=Roseibium aggregatum TaxID=187304 RepID=UPI0006E169FE|nr:hypothetical protein [Roseibium aggregatum]
MSASKLVRVIPFGSSIACDIDLFLRLGCVFCFRFDRSNGFQSFRFQGIGRTEASLLQTSHKGVIRIGTQGNVQTSCFATDFDSRHPDAFIGKIRRQSGEFGMIKSEKFVSVRVRHFSSDTEYN